MTLNGTVRSLTYKQEVGGSSPSPPIANTLQIGHFEGLMQGVASPGTSNSSLIPSNHVRTHLGELSVANERSVPRTVSTVRSTRHAPSSCRAGCREPWPRRPLFVPSGRECSPPQDRAGGAREPS